MDLDKDKRIKKEINKFKKFIKELEKEEKEMAMPLVDELGFMRITLMDLKEEVNNSGVVTEMDQGKYSITRENPALKSYTTMIQRYNATLKQLSDLIFKINPKNESDIDLLGQFIQKR
ncbi:hypothetical protein ABGF26_02670 [Helcococcus ovis]|uniref:hypothetical protein n=1 Tax=Helcococcus ovis TaxID=72026 RepID=UPI0038B779E9